MTWIDAERDNNHNDDSLRSIYGSELKTTTTTATTARPHKRPGRLWAFECPLYLPRACYPALSHSFFFFHSDLTVKMPICIECQYPVQTLWTEYSGAGDKSSGHNIRLTVCRNCGQFCDKYVEHDFVVIFIDLVLIKPQVYRHLLHNTLMREGDQFDVSSCSSLFLLGSFICFL